MKNLTKYTSAMSLIAVAIFLVSSVHAQTTTTTVFDATTNPMYSVQRNDKIQAYNATKPAQSAQTVYTTKSVQTTKPTTVEQTRTKTTTVIDATTNPMYSVLRNDKIEAYTSTLPKADVEKTVVTTKETVKTKTVEQVQKIQGVQNEVTSQAQKQINDAQNKVEEIRQSAQSELSYYESLKTCSVGSFNSTSLVLRTYGLNNGLCSFDVSKLHEKTNRMVKVCSYNAPMEATKQYAADSLKVGRSLAGLEKINTSEYTALTSSLAQFNDKYCK